MARKNRRNRSNGDEGLDPGGWQIVYSGFVLIMLCFFIMLSSFSSMEEAKIMQFVRSFASAVSILPGGLKFESGEMVVPKAPDMVDSMDELAQVFADLTFLSKMYGLEDGIEITQTADGLSMRLSDHALFNLGEAEISVEAIPILKKIGSIVAKTDYLVRIEGHTDDLPIRTAVFPSNWELSTARAVNVLRYLTAEFSLSPQRRSAVGFGEHQTVAPNDSPANRAKNRRVEIIFSKPEKAEKPLGPSDEENQK